MRINRLALLGGAALMLGAGVLSSAVLADTGSVGSGGARGLLNQADTNHDGAVDQAEFQASRDKWFAELDTNNDGFISADELKAFSEKMHAQWAQRHAKAAAQQNDQSATSGATSNATGTTTTPPANTDRADRMVQHIMARVDTDHDGKISKAEFDVQTADLFKRLDKNGDGKIETAELPQRHWGGQLSSRMFDKMDTNGDGKVTLAEFTAANEQMFKKLDTNGDGIISKDEMMAAHHHGKRKGADGQLPDQNAPAQPDGTQGQAPTP